MTKPFAGVITNWEERNNRIHGICVWHKNDMAADSIESFITLESFIATSGIIDKLTRWGYAVVETKNSFYILINKATE